jgi:hypothetical protein
MDMWDEDYFNMETQAYIEITPANGGKLQFGLVTGSLNGDQTSMAKSVLSLLRKEPLKWTKRAGADSCN